MGVVIKYFDPEPDITAFELACVVASVGPSRDFMPVGYIGLQFSEDRWNSLRSSIKRHFKDKPFEG